MKKVIALMLAVLMLGTVAFAAVAADVVPGKKINISRDGVTNLPNGGVVSATLDDDTVVVKGSAISNYIPRSLTSTNYSVTNVKYKVGKGLVESVTINDTEERVEVKMAKDLTNTKTKNFEVSFKLKGKAKYTLKDTGELDSYLTAKGAEDGDFDVNDKVTLPNLNINIIGTVGFGEVEVFLGTDNDEEIDSLDVLYNKAHPDNKQTTDDILEQNIFKFSRSESAKANSATSNTPMPAAGSYTADAILTQEYGDALTLEARVYNGDKLYLAVDYDPVANIIDRLAEADGDLDFYFFDTNKSFVTLNSNASLYFNDADEDSFVYRVNDNGYLVPAGSYSDEDGCWVVKTRTLGQYVVSDIELDDTYVVEDGSDPTTTNPDTGANDVVGIATALAAVALVSAAAISLKK